MAEKGKGRGKGEEKAGKEGDAAALVGEVEVADDEGGGEGRRRRRKVGGAKEINWGRRRVEERVVNVEEREGKVIEVKVIEEKKVVKVIESEGKVIESKVLVGESAIVKSKVKVI